MNTQSTQRFVSYTALPLSASYRSTMQLGSTQRFVSDNDSSACRNSTLLDLPHRFATSLNATQRFVSNIASLLFATSRALAPLTAPHRLSTQRFVNDAAPLRRSVLCCTTFRNAPQRNDLLVTKLRSATIRSASPRNTTQRFVSDNSALGNATLCAATQLNSTQGFVSDTAPLLVASYRFAPLRTSTQRNR